MRVLLTGGTGFLGAHTARALLDAGHEIRVLVRSAGKLPAALEEVGLAADAVEPVEADLTDRPAVDRAIAGCGAVVHTAATATFARGEGAALAGQNVALARTVLGAAVAAGAHAVHVSSTVALARRGGAVLDGSSPLGPGFGHYSRSKVAAEALARELQRDGAPVSIVWPGAIVGPQDPSLGANNASLRDVLRGLLPVWPRGGQQYVDVRDAAAVLAAVVGHGPGGRWPVPGEQVERPHAVLREVTGRRLPAVALPAAAVAAAATPGYLTGLPLLPDQREAAWLFGCANPVDASVTTARLGVRGRPVRTSYGDTVRWLVEAGHLPARLAGRAASEPPLPTGS